MSHYRAATAITGCLFAMLVVALPAAAQDTSGGNGGGSDGGVGGASNPAAPGDPGVNSVATGGGGGGGAGTDGGAGGTGSSLGPGIVPGGVGGVGPGGNGGAGGGGHIGAGGGGGAHGYVDAVLPTTFALGGSGGAGGNAAGPGAGGGGAGGYGAVVTGGGDLGTLGVSVTGGAGGAGGSGFVTTSGVGGAGGHGLVLTTPSTVVVGASVTGGAGGPLLTGPFGNQAGVGGHGIVGSGLQLTVDAAVSGGLSGDGAARGYAIYFTGGSNALTLGSSGGLTGGIGLAGAALTLNSVVDGADLDLTTGSNSLTLGEGVGFAGAIRVAGGSLTLNGENNLTGGIDLAGTLYLGSSNAAGGAANTITTTGSVISYADSVDSATPIVVDSDTTQLEVLGGDLAAQSGTISETGGARPIEKIGKGTLILSATNSYSGGTLVTGGLINFAVGENLGSGNVTLNGGGLQWAMGNALDISDRLEALGAVGGTFDTNGNDVTLAGVISGGVLTKSGAGTLTLTGVNAYTGGTTIGGGQIHFATGDNLGTGNITLNGGGLQWAVGNTLDITARLNALGPGGGAFDTNGNDVTLAGAITGSGSITKVGAGTLTLTGANSYSGTWIYGGTVNFFGAGNLGTGNVLLDGGTLQWAAGNTFDVSSKLDPIGEGGGAFDTNGNAVTFASAIAGTGAITKAGGGTLTLTADSSYAGNTTIAAGTLQVGAGGTSGSLGMADVLDNGVLVFNRSDDIAIGALISGTGSLVHAGSGLLVLTGDNSYAGTTTISVGTLQVGNGGMAGSLGTGDVLNDSSLVFDRSDDSTFAGAISGAGSLTHAGTGTLTLTGANTYAGGTTIASGTLQIGIGGSGASFGSGDVLNDGTLVVNRLDDLGFAGAIDGSGSLTKLGEGTLTLTGFNTYSGTTSILGGTLEASGGSLSNTDLVEIGNGATLRVLQNTFFNDAELLDGGGTIDTGAYFLDIAEGLTFTGQLTKTGEGELYLIDFSDTGNGSGGISVTAGTLVLGGDNAAGTGTIFLADGTTLVNGACYCGTLELDNEIVIAAPGAATIDGSGYFTQLNGTISGGNLHFVSGGESSEGGGSIFLLNGLNSYGDTTIGANVAVVLQDGTLGTGNTTFEDVPSDPSTPSALVFANTGDYTYEGTISGAGLISVETDPATTITFAGSNSSGNNFTGEVLLSGGHLVINGEFGDIDNNSALLTVDASCLCGGPEDAVLGGSGTFHGDVEFVSGTLAPGNSPDTLTIVGDLALGAGTILDYELGQSGAVGGANNDLAVVGGDLTLDGTLNTMASGLGYGPGYYALFRYGGTLTDNTLDIGAIDGGLSSELLLNIAGQVNIRLGPQVTQYWDGADVTGSGTAANGNGGAGTWSAANTNWTAAAGFGINDAWRSTTAVFAGASGGLVTVDGTQSFQDLLFQTDGYVLQAAGGGGQLATTGGFSIVDVAGGLTADIGVEITGAAGLTKTGTGTLILSAQSTYTGTTDVTAGTLRMGIDFPLFSDGAVTVAAGATFDLADHYTQIGSLSGAGSVLTGAGTLVTGGDDTSTLFSGAITGAGTIAKTGTGNWTLSGSSSVDFGQLIDGTLTIADTASVTFTDNISVYGLVGTPTLVNDGAIVGKLNALAGVIDNNGTITGPVWNYSTAFTNDGTITGDSIFNLSGGILTNNGLIASGVSNGELGVATLYNAGTVTGTFYNYGGGTLSSTGVINGTLYNQGTASLQNQLNGWIINHSLVTLTGATFGISQYIGNGIAILDLANFDMAIGAISGDGEIRLGSAALTTGAGDLASLFSGVISGSGGLTKVGAGSLNLSGVNTYAGITEVNEGALWLMSTGQIAGSLHNAAVFSNDGTLGGQLLNTGSANNNGTLAGGVDNSGSFASTGTINLGVVNAASGSFAARGQINGAVDNSGMFEVTGALTGVGIFLQAATGQTYLYGVDLTVGALQGDGGVDLGAGTLTTGDATSVSFLGAITGSGNLTKVGAGELELGGTNTFTGTTTISGGTLRVTGSLASNTVQNDATFNNAGTVGGFVSASAGATTDNSGTILGGASNSGTFTSTGTVYGGASNSGTFTSTGTVYDGFANVGTASFRGVLIGEVSNAAGIITLTGQTDGIGRVIQSAGAVFDLGSYETEFGSLDGAGEVWLNGARLTVGRDDSDSTFAGIITSSGPGGFAKLGIGTMVLSGVNTYTGITEVHQGTLSLASTGQLAGQVYNAATFVNAGNVGDSLLNAGIVSNSGTLGGGVNNQGTLTSTGTIELGVLNHEGHSILASGQINGFVVNMGAFEVTGALSGIPGFLQADTGHLDLADFDLTVGELRGEGTIDLGSATLTVGGSNTSAGFNGVVSGTGGLTKVGTGTLTLYGDNSYLGTTTISDGAIVIGLGGTTGTLGEGDIVNDGFLHVNRLGTLTIDSVITGTGAITNLNAGTLVLAGDNTPGNDFTGTVQVFDGSLVIDGAFGDATGNTAQLTVDAGASLGGSGTFLGSAIVNGTLAPGNSPGTLTIAGDLALGAAAILNYEFGASGTPGGPNNDLVVIGGNLTLDGTLNAAAFGPGYGSGYYRLFDYGGSLTDNGLAIGTIDGGLSASVLTNIGGQVNVVLGPQLVQYWDGGDMTGAFATVNGDGGNGTWSSSNTNWTSAAGFGINDQWRSQVGVFAGTPGGSNNVTIVGTQSFQELRFETGYTLTGSTAADGLATTGGFSVIDVQGAVSINAPISGAGGLTKTGSGTLVLGGTNTYTGLTTISGPSTSALVLVPFSQLAGPVLNNARLDNMGTIQGLVTNNGTMESFNTLNGGLVNSGTALIGGNANGSLTNLAGGVVTLHFVSGIGAVDQADGGTLILDTSTTIGSLAGAGSVQLGTATLVTGGNNGSTVFAGAISGSGGLTKTGTGTLTLSGANTFTGTTTVSAGILANSGSLAGPVVNQATFTSTGLVGSGLTNSGTANVSGQLNGAVANSGLLNLTGATTGIGALSQTAAGTFVLNGFNTSVGSLSGAGQVQLGAATLTSNGDNSSTTFAGIISGTGRLTKTGTGTLTLSGLNVIFGDTTVSAGTLAITSASRVGGDVFNNATFTNAGTVGVALYNSAGATATNSGTLTFGVVNSGTFTTTGTMGLGAINYTGATMFAQGQINGFLVNSGAFDVTGPLTGITLVYHEATGHTDLHGFDLTTETLEGDGTIALGGATWTTGGGNSSFEWAGEMSGTGGLAKVGTGTLTLSGVNTYTGTTRVEAGALLNSGSLAGPVVNLAAFTSTGTVTGALTNSGTARIQGTLAGDVANLAGTLTFTGLTSGIGLLTQSAGAATVVDHFTSIDLGGLAGAGSVAVGNGIRVGSANLDTQFDGSLTGTNGGLTKVGTGTLTLTGTSDLSLGTQVLEGRLVLASTGWLSQRLINHAAFDNAGVLAGFLRNEATGTVTNTGALADDVYNNGVLNSTGSIGGSLFNGGTALLSGHVSVLNNAAGSATLTGATTMDGVVQLDEATFDLAGNSLELQLLYGGGTIALGGATLTVGADVAESLFRGTIGGPGNLAKIGTERLTLSGANTYTGTTTIAAGTLQLGDGGPSGSLASTAVVNNGVLSIDRTGLLQLSAAISGSGGLVHAGTGTTLLTGANSYTGGTLVSAGRLVGNATSLQGAIQSNATLEFAQANNGTYAGSLSGAGAFEKTGAGWLALTGDSSSFTGVTRALSGQLVVNGLLSRSVVTVGPGATLLGIGTIGGLVAQAGSVVAPGNSIGTLSVAGNVQFQAGSTFQAEVSAAAADLISATGTAQIAGTLALSNLGGTYMLGTTYVLVDAAGGRTGTFDLMTGASAFGPRFRPRVVYTATQVQLLMAANLLAELAGSDLTPNQTSFLGGFDAAVLDGYDPQPLYALYNLSPEGIRRAVDQLSGGVYPAAASAALEEERLVREAAVDRLRLTQDSEATGTGAWGQLVGSWGHTNSDGNGFDVDENREGMIFGVDTGGEGWRIGLFGHHLETELDADALGSEARIDRTGAGAYAGFASDSFRARVGASYSDLEIGASRSIVFPGFSAAAQSESDGSMVQGFGEVAYRFDIGDKTVFEPFADLALATLDLDAIAETGSAAAQLRVEEQEHDVGRAIAGLRGDTAIETGGMRLRIDIDAGLQHNFGDRTVAALIALDDAPQFPFTVGATELEPWAFVGGSRVKFDFGGNVTATIAYRGVLAGHRNDHAASGTLSVRF